MVTVLKKVMMTWEIMDFGLYFHAIDSFPNALVGVQRQAGH